jgi:pimeloyl-ACP methyl ester carboxylesterase
MREHAKEDFPAMVKAILRETRHEKVSVYGTSQGALVSLMGTAKNPSLNKSLSLLVAVSPALVLRPPTNPLVSLVFTMDETILGERQ